jgi:hypothetical protein
MMRSRIASFNRFGGSFAKRLIGSILTKQRLFFVSPRRGHAGRTVELLPSRPCGLSIQPCLLHRGHGMVPLSRLALGELYANQS